jgi:uncharacterized RDD family membrane protein YckC
MFKIIGADGKEYGPVGEAQVRHWMSSGRASLDTQAQAVGEIEWRPLRTFSQFSDQPPLMRDPVAAVPPALPTAPLAGRGARTGAALINAFIYFLCIMPGSLVMSRTLLANNPSIREGRIPRPDEIDMTGLVEAMIWFWMGLGVAILVQAVLLAWRGQNLGKLMTGVRVVRADNGEPAGFVRGALLRFVLPVAFMILLHGTTLVLGVAFLVLDYCFIFREDRRCLHDLIAGTIVVRR